ncbi:hypothetical protein GP484_12505 [Mammaliicoccus sciuri]|uniref:hypothetical protein n=1 Tax=Mammaliicoccus sciuri TaxID=1296 RepID=UPI001C4F288E|nr:hypothetical protein [Mammaliicoccus sciuri]MCD3220690.1 hypothetical protein [Mammaliicoccus sciuri]
MNKIDEKDKMVQYLKKDNQLKVKEYVEGYLSAKEIAEEINVKRHIFYNAMDMVDSGMSEKRKSNRYKILRSVVQQIEECIPYEYMEFDYEKYYGRYTSFTDKSVSIQKKKITNSMIDAKCYPDDFLFISLKTLKSWYRNYLMSKVILGGEVPISRAAKAYKMTPANAYKLRDYMKSNHNRILSAPNKPVTDKQESVFLRNVEIYHKYIEEHKIQDLANEYNINKKYLKRIIKSLEYVDLELSFSKKTK